MVSLQVRSKQNNTMTQYRRQNKLVYSCAAHIAIGPKIWSDGRDEVMVKTKRPGVLRTTFGQHRYRQKWAAGDMRRRPRVLIQGTTPTTINATSSDRHRQDRTQSGIYNRARTYLLRVCCRRLLKTTLKPRL